MTRIAGLLLAGVLGLAAVTPLSAQPPRPVAEPERAPAPPDIHVRSSLSQTAAWVGDPLEFVVEIETAPGVEIVADDLLPEKLVVEGLELGPSTSSETPRADGWRVLRRQYRVTAWDTTPPKRIGEITLRFRRPVTAATADGSAPGTEVKVPGAVLPVRSTLPDDGSADGTRDHLTRVPPPGWLAWLRPAGLGLVILGLAPVALWMVAFVRRPRLARPRPSSRSLHARVKTLFDELAVIDIGSPDGRRRAYDRIDGDVRAYLAEAEGVPATALTADELRPRLATSRRVQGDGLCDILAECEHARYAPVDRLPGADAVSATVERLRTALGQ